MSGNVDQIGFSDAELWRQYLSGVSVAALAAAWNVSTQIINMQLINYAQANGLAASWTTAQRTLANSKNPN
jgi:hypothetical protein